eukprot:1016273-Amphidinium_carterae.1
MKPPFQRQTLGKKDPSLAKAKPFWAFAPQRLPRNLLQKGKARGLAKLPLFHPQKTTAKEP